MLYCFGNFEENMDQSRIHLANAIFFQPRIYLISYPFFGNLITHITISEKQVYFPREGCEVSDNISICEIGNDKLIIPAHFQNNTKHQHLGLYLKDSSDTTVGAFLKKTAEKLIESLNDKDGCWELSSDGEGMKIIQVYQQCYNE